MDGHSPEITKQLLNQLKNLVPEAFSEGRLDEEALKRSLGEEHTLEKGERYHLDWPGKSAAYKLLQAPSSATLRPQPDLSVSFDTAEHVFIEGENLEVLKVLQKAYFGKVKLIYIDPPYNTGSDSFIYPDRFQESKADYLKRINELSDDGNLMREGFFRKNNKENGHYHSNWLNMMLPRLYLARNLLREDGFIVVSLDDNEFYNARALLNEIFGEENFVAVLVYDRNRKNDAKLFSVGHEYMLVYARNKGLLTELNVRLRAPKEGIDEIREEFERLRKLHHDQWDLVEQGLREFYASFDEDDPRQPLTRFKKVDAKGPYRTDRDASWPGGGGPRFDVPHPITQKPCKIPSRGWIWSSYERMKVEIDKGYVIFGPDETTIPSVRMNLFENTEQVMRSVIFSYAQKATQDFAAIFGGKKVFDNPKNYFDLERIIQYLSNYGDLILDFFAGTATTAHGVLLANTGDFVPRRFICVQLPETLEDENEASRNALALGCHTIADIARERIRRVIQKIQEEADLASPAPANLGFKSFVLAPSNFKQWRGDDIETAEQLAEQLELFVQSEKDGAEVADILYELLLKSGYPLTTPLEKLDTQGEPVWRVGGGELLMVLEGFHFDMIEPLLALAPKEILCLDSVFEGSDELKTNLDLQCRDAKVRFTCI